MTQMEELTLVRSTNEELRQRNYSAKQLNTAHVETINGLRTEVERLTKELKLSLELNGICNDKYIILAAQHEAERKAIAEAVIQATYDPVLADRIVAGEFEKEKRNEP